MFIYAALIFVIIFLIIILAGYIVIERFHVTPLRKFQLIVSYLGGLSALLLTTEIYFEITSANRIEKNKIAYNTLDNVQKNFLAPQQELLNHFPEGFFLYASLNPDVNFDGYEPTEYNRSKRKQLEVYSALRIFQAVEDFVSTAQYNVIGNYVWINGFLMWLQSPILQDYWPIFAFNYAADTRAIIDQLIVHASQLRALRIQKGKLEDSDYDSISKSFALMRP
jgi:hypothetical protein